MRISSTAITKRMIYWSCAGCTLSFTAELSALDRITGVEKKLDCVDSFIREVTLLRNEIALIKKPEFPFLKIAKSGAGSHQGCQKAPEASSIICRSIESEHNSIRNGGVLCRKEHRTTSYLRNFEIRSSPESLPLCI